MGSINLPISCSACGSKEFRLPAEPQPDDVVTCNGCEKTWRYADLQAATREAAKEAIGKVFRDAFRKR